MSIASLKDEAAIVGIGATRYYQRGESRPLTETELACQAIFAALADAGLSSGSPYGSGGVAPVVGFIGYTFTIIRHPLHPGLEDVVPYVSGVVVEFDEPQGAGARLFGNIIDCAPDEVQVGDKVEVAFEPVSDSYAVLRFRWAGRG